MRTVVIGHAAFTLAMFGLMWAVQIVIYPQFRSVAPANFAAYAADHSVRITRALALLAPAEIIFAAWLWLDPPTGIERSVVLLSGIALGVGWVSTALWFGPLHGKFQDGTYDAERIERLIRTNWIRTALWTVRAILASWFLWQVVDR